MTLTRCLILLAAIVSQLVAGLTGCSSADNKAGFNSDTGKHIASWITDHGPAYLSDTTICVECHGTDFHGGITSVSCFSASFGGMTCHANGPGHVDPTSWRNPAQHGAAAKATPNAATLSGFAVCEICHGTTFQGIAAYSPACDSCHGGSAPHPTSWITQTYFHMDTNPGNAPVCSLCHLNGANSPIAPPSPPAPPGTAPECFNNSLCHASIHAAGWSNPSSHGVAAKSAPNVAAMQGFSTCQTCHGINFSGGTSLTACSACHGGSAPHPTSWLPGSTYHHNTTNQANAPVCAQCHRSSAGSPGCFNNTLCHGNPD